MAASARRWEPRGLSVAWSAPLACIWFSCDASELDSLPTLLRFRDGVWTASFRWPSEGCGGSAAEAVSLRPPLRRPDAGGMPDSAAMQREVEVAGNGQRGNWWMARRTNKWTR